MINNKKTREKIISELSKDIDKCMKKDYKVDDYEKIFKDTLEKIKQKERLEKIKKIFE